MLSFKKVKRIENDNDKEIVKNIIFSEMLFITHSQIHMVIHIIALI